jgi:hypothetical protein
VSPALGLIARFIDKEPEFLFVPPDQLPTITCSMMSRTFFMHVWANDDAGKLARGLREALNRVNLARELGGPSCIPSARRSAP